VTGIRWSRWLAITLVSTYVGAMEGDDSEANALPDEVLATTGNRLSWPARCEIADPRPATASPRS
jgi:hypothetical protein